MLFQESGVPERARESVNRCRKMLERWENRFTFENPAFLERYFKGDLVFHVHFRVRHFKGIGPDVEYCAVLQDAERVVSDLVKDHGAVEKGNGRQLCGHEGDGVVLVGVIETPNRPKRVAHIKCADRVQDVHGRFDPALFFSPKSGFGTLGRVAGGKIVPADMPVSVTGALPEMVERDVQVVNGIPDNSAPSIRDGFAGLHHGGGVDVRAVRLRVALTDNSVWASATECGNLGFEITDVFVGPFDLDAPTTRPRSQRAY